MNQIALICLGVSIAAASVRADGTQSLAKPSDFPNIVFPPAHRAREAAKENRFAEALSSYLEALADVDASDVSWELTLRDEALKTALKIRPLPAPSAAAVEFERRGERAAAQNTPEGFRAAREEFRRAVLLAPAYAQAIFNLGLVEDKLGNTELALANLNMYVATNPPDATKVRARATELSARVNQMVNELDRACAVDTERGDARACTTLGSWLTEWVGVDALSIDLSKFNRYELLDVGCRRGDATGCGELVRLLENSVFDPRPLVEIYLEGRPGVPANAAKAIEVLEKSCQDSTVMNRAGACLAVGFAYDSGFGVPRDPAKAGSLYTTACGVANAAECFTKLRVDLFFIVPESLKDRLFNWLCDTGQLQCVR